MEQKAINYSKNFHSQHFRRSGKTYFDHSRDVAENLKSHKISDESTIVSAYLHHVLSFDPNAEEELMHLFGEEVCQILKKYKNLSEYELHNIFPNEENEKLIIQTYFSLVEDPRVLFIRLADKVENIKTVEFLPKEKAETVAKRALYLYAPLCRLLGIYSYVKALEDTAFRYLQPNEFKKIEELILKDSEKYEKILKEYLDATEGILKEKGIFPKVTYRVKHEYSIFKKFEKYSQEGKNQTSKPTGNMDVHDIYAVRFIVNTIKECYMVESILDALFNKYPDLRDDYIHKPKSNGYQSIHNIYRLGPNLDVEIQIRTQEMHEYAEYGYASHAFYKVGEALRNIMNPGFTDLRGINFREVGQNINLDIFSGYVYAFTPKGKIIKLPKGANLIDFAYEIHSDIGNSCTGGFVNGKHEKLTYEIKTGDKIIIETSKIRKGPSKDWIHSVKSKKAKYEIKKFFAEEL